MDVRDTPLDPQGYQKVTALSTVKSLVMPATGPGPVASGNRVRSVLLKTEVQAVRWTDDGSTPSATDGMLLDVGDEFFYSGKVSQLQFIEVVAGAVLHASLYA